MSKLLKVFVVLLIATPVVAQAKPSLWTYPRVDAGLFSMGVAYGIRENCNNLVERKFYSATFALRLSNYAKEQGYTSDEVRAFVKSDVEKAKLRERVENYFGELGLDYETPNALCDYGESLIAEKTQVGKFLRKN